MNDEKLPAAGWNENQLQSIIERALLEDDDFCTRAAYQNIRQIIARASAKAIVEAILHNAPPDSGAGKSVTDLRIYCGDNPLKWAEEFCQIKQKQGWSVADIDENLMLGWFANAIEQSSDVRGCSALPAPMAANASAERDWSDPCDNPKCTAPACVANRKCFCCDGTGNVIDDPDAPPTARCEFCGGSGKAAANASCDKQGEAKCSECGGSGSIEIDDGHFIKCKCATAIRSARDGGGGDAQPDIQWDHIDGPLLHSRFAQIEWLTWRERFLCWIGREDASSLERKHWPKLAERWDRRAQSVEKK